MASEKDDLEAVRALVQTLEPFKNEERIRIIRWASEKLGIPGGHISQTTTVQPHVGGGSAASAIQVATGAQKSFHSTDIKTFVANKAPQSDRHLAAVIAYYYTFEAPENERKEAIGSDELIDACRKAGVHRPKNPGQTLRNACFAGFIDKATDRGKYKINSVGENLVAMVLPGGTATTTGNAATKRKKKKQPAKSRR